METYQEEYDRILREIQELKKSRNLSDDQRKKMEEMQKRADTLEDYVNESGRLLARISDLQTEITTDMTKIYQMQQMVAEHSDDNSNLSNDEIKKMRKYLFEITGSKRIIQADESTLKRILETQAKRYDISNSVVYRFSTLTKIDELNGLCDAYRELQESFAEGEKTHTDTSDSRDTGTSDQEKKSKAVVEGQENKLKEQEKKIEALRKINTEIGSASKKLEEKRKALDEAKKSDLNDDEKQAINKEIKKAKDDFWEKIEEFKNSNAENLYEELEDDAKGKLGLKDEDKAIERERIRLIIKLLNTQIAALKSELDELNKNPAINFARIKQLEKELEGLNDKLSYWNERYKETQILSENPKDWKPLSNVRSNVSSGQYVSQPTQSTSNQPVPEGKQLQKTTDFIGRIKDVVQKIKNFYFDKTSDDKKDLAAEAKAQAYKKKREERINSLNDSNFIGNPVEKSRGDMQYLAFPPAKVVGADFYHTVQIGDKLQYVKEPLADIDFSEDAIKARIYELQERFGNTARERQGKRIGILEKYRYEHKKMDDSEKRDYEIRQAYQKLLENPDKILRDFIGEAKKNVVKKYKAIKLMCALEAANNVEEAAKACLHGMPKDLFGLGVDPSRTSFAYGQLANGSLQNDIEKSDMAIAEKIRENLRISRTARSVRTVGFTDPSLQPQPVITPNISQADPQPVITPSANKRSFRSKNRGKSTDRQEKMPNADQLRPQQPTIPFPRNGSLVVRGNRGRSEATRIPPRIRNINRSDAGRDL